MTKEYTGQRNECFPGRKENVGLHHTTQNSIYSTLMNLFFSRTFHGIFSYQSSLWVTITSDGQVTAKRVYHTFASLHVVIGDLRNGLRWF